MRIGNHLAEPTRRQAVEECVLLRGETDAAAYVAIGPGIGAENPDFERLDISLRYGIPLGSRFDVTLLADFFNVLDETNFDSIDNGRVGTGTFLTPTSAFNPQERQIGVRVEV